MEITIKGTPKEIADLVRELQSQPDQGISLSDLIGMKAEE